MASPADHVSDGHVFHVPQFLWKMLPEAMRDSHPGSVHVPHFDYTWAGEAHTFYVTKYMCLEVLALAILLFVFIPFAWKVAKGEPPKGRWFNLLEAFLLYIRDEVARPTIGKKDADRFLPFLWTIFFFVLTCNLLGMVPWMGSPTGALAVTAVLAISTLLVVCSAGMAKYGPIGFWIGLVPHMELPLVIGIVLKPMMFVIEVAALLIKHVVLSIRLLANMFAGHMVLAVVLGFIAGTAESGLALWIGVTAASVLGSVALSCLELFVAFLQAYIFVFLSSLFIGMAVHQH